MSVASTPASAILMALRVRPPSKSVHCMDGPREKARLPASSRLPPAKSLKPREPLMPKVG